MCPNSAASKTRASDVNHEKTKKRVSVRAECNGRETRRHENHTKHGGAHDLFETNAHDKENKGKSSTGNYMKGRTHEKQWESCVFVA